MRGLGSLLGALVVTGAVGIGLAQGAPSGRAQGADCSGAADGTHVVTGTFTKDLEGAYVMVPFDIPAGATRVRVRLDHGGIDVPNPVTKHTLDLGLYQPRSEDRATAGAPWGPPEFRGWGGSSRLDVCVSPDRATLGFRPGPIPAGRWAAEIGVAAVAGPAEGDLGARVPWTLTVEYSNDPAHADDPWTPAPYDETPVRTEPGWYAGDFHVHGEHSNPADAPMGEVFEAAFAPDGADLDFVTLSDYVTDRHWDEIGPFQEQWRDDGKLIIRSAEVITYRGHVVNHASLRRVDHRTGAVYEWDEEAGAPAETPMRPARPASAVLADIHGGGRGWTQVAHPTTFPATVPGFGNFCRGCSWEYSDDETDWSLVDAMEVQTGPAGTGENIQGQRVGPEADGALGPNPFTPLALERFDRLHRSGYDITAVGASDSHKAARQDLLFSPIGEAHTVVRAEELSETGIRDGILAGHAYVKFFGPHGPDLRFEATPVGGGAAVIMGDELEVAAARFRAVVLGRGTGPGPLTLSVFKDGIPFLAFPVPASEAAAAGGFGVEFVGAAPGDYRLQLQRGTAIEAITNPITLVPPPLLP